MDYKKLIKSRNIRIKIMQLLSFLPDEWMVRFQYRIKLGRKLNLKKPQRFTEKLQWYKLYYRNPLMTKCVDKYDVREYVKECGLEEILNEIYGIYDTPEEIDFDKLPNQFVMKDTLGGGGNSVIIITNKASMNKAEIMEKMKQWVSEPINKKHPGREWVYDGKKHRILVEKYLEVAGDLPDYKFYCFSGKVECFYVRKDYSLSHEKGKMCFYNRDCEYIPVGLDYCKASGEALVLPHNIEGMLDVAEKIAKGFPHIRVDLYNVDNAILFGEMTFFSASGYFKFEPDEFDYKLGSYFKIQKEESNE